MATKIFMEALSPTMEEGRLVKWMKNEGDAVKSGEPLAEVETDKAIMELVARGDGILRKRLVAEGESRPVGTLVGVIASKDENIDELIRIADSGQRTAGAAAAAAAPAAGVRGGAALASPSARSPLAEAVPRRDAPPLPPPAAVAPASGPGTGERTRSSPLARRMASERGLDIGGVQGSGPGGRIIKRDIDAAASGSGLPGTYPTTDFDDIALTQIRKTIARRLAESIGPIPTFYLTAAFDLTRAVEMRTAMLELGDEFKVSINDILLKAVATALAQHPEVNAHWLGDRIRQHHRVHLGMAVATDDGLIVPVIFDADQKRLSEISRETKALAKLARERRLKPEQYTGSTFSVSNLGMMQIDQFTAIINPPEVAILAVGAAEDVPIVVDGELKTQKRLRVTMSCDHRAVDGAVGARFLVTLRRLVENPLMLVY
jgi:pyruvate dehydrogenase E2 component (dihydrolipoamide acetyltransferase)